MGSVLLISVVTCAVAYATSASFNQKVNEDVMVSLLEFGSNDDWNNARLVCKRWKDMATLQWARRWGRIGSPKLELCLEGFPIADYAKRIKDGIDDDEEKTVLLITPSANVRFSFNKQDPDHPSGFHMCTKFSDTFPAGRNMIWQLVEKDMAELPYLFGDETPTKMPCELCRLSKQQSLKLLKKMVVPVPPRSIQRFEINEDLELDVKFKGSGGFQSHGKAIFEEEDMSKKIEYEFVPDEDLSQTSTTRAFSQIDHGFNIGEIFSKDVRCSEWGYEPFVYTNMYQCWITGDILAKITAFKYGEDEENEETEEGEEERSPNYLVLFDKECRSIRMCLPMERDTGDEIELTGSVIALKDSSDGTVSYHCSDRGKLIREPQTNESEMNHCQLCGSKLSGDLSINDLESSPDWNDLVVKCTDQSKPDSTEFGVYQRQLIHDA